MDGSRELLGLPIPRQRPLELMGLGLTRDPALEHVGQPRQGLDPVELRGRPTCLFGAVRPERDAGVAPVLPEVPTA
jgi:hypothetical protein